MIGDIHTPPLSSFYPQPFPFFSFFCRSRVFAKRHFLCLCFYRSRSERLNAPAGEHNGALWDKCPLNETLVFTL